MATASDVITAMKIGCIYRICDLAAQIPGASTDEVKRVINMLEKGGMVEGIMGDGYRRKKLYTTRQQCLPLGG